MRLQGKPLIRAQAAEKIKALLRSTEINRGSIVEDLGNWMNDLPRARRETALLVFFENIESPVVRESLEQVAMTMLEGEAKDNEGSGLHIVRLGHSMNIDFCEDRRGKTNEKLRGRLINALIRRIEQIPAGEEPLGVLGLRGVDLTALWNQAASTWNEGQPVVLRAPVRQLAIAGGLLVEKDLLNQKDVSKVNIALLQALKEECKNGVSRKVAPNGQPSPYQSMDTILSEARDEPKQATKLKL